MDILKIKNEDGSWSSISSLMGLKGEKGNIGQTGLKGEPGIDGKNISINKKNTLTISQGQNISLNQEENNLTISAITGGKKYTRFVVGNSSGGWTAEDVDFYGEGPAIQAAIDALPESGGEIFLLNGSYSLYDEIKINKERVILRGIGNNVYLNKYPIKQGEKAVVISKSHITISNLQIKNTYTYIYGFYGVYIDSSDESILTDIHILNSSCKNCRYGFYCNIPISHGSFINNSGENSETHNEYQNGFRIKGDNLLIENNSTFYFSGGFLLENISNSKIFNNKVFYPYINDGLVLNNSSNTLVIKNKCVGGRESEGLAVSNSSNILIIGNYCDGSRNGLRLYNSTDSIVSYNICYTGYVDGARDIKVDGDKSANNIIANNFYVRAGVSVQGINTTVENNIQI